MLASLIVMIGAYSYILPNLTDMRTSERLAAEINRFAPNVKSRAIHSPHYTEPSLIYHAGTDINLKAGAIDLSSGKIVILNGLRDETDRLMQDLTQAASERGQCLASSNLVSGFNYSKGKPLSLYVLKEEPCAAFYP